MGEWRERERQKTSEGVPVLLPVEAIVSNGHGAFGFGFAHLAPGFPEFPHASSFCLFVGWGNAQGGDAFSVMCGWRGHVRWWWMGGGGGIALVLLVAFIVAADGSLMVYVYISLPRVCPPCLPLLHPPTNEPVAPPKRWTFPC